MSSNYRFNQRWLIGLLCLVATGRTTLAADSGQPRDLNIAARLSGDCPVAAVR